MVSSPTQEVSNLEQQLSALRGAGTGGGGSNLEKMKNAAGAGVDAPFSLLPDGQGGCHRQRRWKQASPPQQLAVQHSGSMQEAGSKNLTDT